MEYTIGTDSAKGNKEVKKMIDVRPTWMEVNLDTIAHNMRQIRRITHPQAEILAVVKANAYGHGAIDMSRVVLQNGADRLGVATTAEGIALREAGIKVPILILGLISIEQIPEVVDYNLTQTVCTWECAKKLSQYAVFRNKMAKIHVKIDTGMGRIGLLPEEALDFIRRVIKLPKVEVEGLFTHFPSADEIDKTYTFRQIEQFQKVIRQLEKEDIFIPVQHAANSAGVIDMPEAHFTMVRPGMIMYGLYPSEHVNHTIGLRPALSLKSRVIYLKQVPAGSYISYGRIYKTERPSVIGTLPIGYADGWSRLLSGKGEVIIHGQKVPIVGRISMDQCMIDVTDVPGVKLYDEVVLIGQQGNCEITVDEVAEKMGTINYEVICIITNRVPRVYVG